ncbi:Ig-like domain-containing protein [Streptomyces sp. NPDC086787]|uniref:Ig-like domain-containing protein n=1 Tax=Streptomyces sp. NPDC086787 TaxID=3365759 RepID=UPI0038014DC0
MARWDSASSIVSRNPRRWAAWLCQVLVGAMVFILFPAASSAFAATITTPGPLSAITISPQLNCNVTHVGDAQPSWFAGNACGTFIALNGTLFGPSSVPAGGSAGPRTPYTPVSQSAVTGSGTEADPYKVVTVVNAGPGITLTQTDSYVVGRETYDTTVVVANASGASQTGNIYTAGDCFLQDSDESYGRVVGTSPACSASPNAGSRIVGLLPRTGGNSYIEDIYDTVWSQIGSQQPFSNTCTCTDFTDSGIGISWPVSLADGASTTYQWSTAFSPSGTFPLDVSASAASPQTATGGTNAYTVSIANPNVSDATLDTIAVELPAGFSYRPGSTTGVTSSDPDITGNSLTWHGPFILPANGAVSLTFGVTVSSMPGTYTIDATATSPDAEVTPSVDTAAIEVFVAPPVITSPPNGSVLAQSPPTFTGTGEAGSTLTLSEAGVTLCTTTVNATGTWTCTLPRALSPGTHKITPSTRQGQAPAVDGTPITVIRRKL